MVFQREQLPDGSATDRTRTDYGPHRWKALTCSLDDGQLPFAHNRREGQIRPIAVGQHNWLLLTGSIGADAPPT
ncbi:MAG: hypothetical protein RIS35_3615 [Pseudomonadota bacterium]|jgi:hypothetical protein